MDYSISEKGGDEWYELLAGDYVYKDDNKQSVTIISYFDFEEYWEKNKE